jgi:hypothetical protein
MFGPLRERSIANSIICALIAPTTAYAQIVTIGPGPEGIKLTLEKLVRRDAFFPEAMSVHLIVENLETTHAEKLTIHCRAVDVDGFTLERSSPGKSGITSLQPAEKIRVVVSIPEHASTNKVVCNLN